ncbi:uncharacterized protein ACA1_092630 [Acanthamoeba castellanii str. Neff]|uniref:GATA-type domain-containing protein n=1 Tax=Acanthamoeba castellanii (strain ATCC 30010 / Neff) TaxID=1257118 RepID=L8GI26_ACACF|nr:uncharacterized protein ACA1_092630 [Acanthamoeba castellanii str. Neff]ELR12730.1 hypothetical protein ACA1_092630 [Acanthamoeba castellanii str. Neff]
MNSSQPVPSSTHHSASAFFEATTPTDRRPLPTVRALHFDAPLAPTMADLAQAASSQASYYDIAASASSLSFLASKAQRAPLSRDEWDQFTTTTQQLRRAFLALHGGRSSSPTHDLGTTTSSASSSYHYPTTATTTATSPSSLGFGYSSTTPSYPSSPMSSPSPSPTPGQQRSLHTHTHTSTRLNEEEQQLMLLLSVERRPRSRSHKVCAHCGTTESSQWRRGPFDKAIRNFAKKKQQKSDRQQMVAEARQSTSGGTRSDIYDLLN